MKFKIERDKNMIPPPYGIGTVSRAMYDALKRCKVKDSFVIENPHYTTYTFIKQIPEFKDKTFVGRTEDSQHKRIWRIK